MLLYVLYDDQGLFNIREEEPEHWHRYIQYDTQSGVTIAKAVKNAIEEDEKAENDKKTGNG